MCKDRKSSDPNNDDELKNLIIKKQVNVNLVQNEKSGLTPLGEAASRGDTVTVDLLIKNGANVNCKGFNGWTPLHEAAFRGHSDTVEFLLKNGANGDCKDNYGRNPLNLAITNNKTQVIELLTKYSSK